MNALSYYAQLARRITPADLARVAARRAFRTAWRVLARHPPEVPSEVILTAYGVSESSQLPAAVAATGTELWADPSHRASVRAALRGVPGAAERALERAERAAARTFDVFGARVAFAEGEIDWWLDPGSARRYPPAPSSTLDLLQPGMDAKFPWVFGRLDCLVALGQGAWCCESPRDSDRFAAAFVDQLQAFLLANPPGVGIQWTCPMEVALRAANMALALRMFLDAPALTPQVLLHALAALATHAAFVETHLEDEGAVPNNHLLANHVGLLVVAAAFPGLPEASRHTELATAGLREQLSHQVHDDGASFEGSIPYHRLATELLTLAYLARGECAEPLHRMFGVARAYCSPGGLAPQLGDNDSGRALPLADRPSLEHGYLASLGAALFRDPELKDAGDGLCDEALWLLGAGGLEAYRALPSRGSRASFSSPAAGWHVLRGPDAMVAVSAGPLGQRGAGGHNHNDQLSLELHVGRTPVLVDPGSPTYGRDAVRRNAYRATSMHNTFEVDGTEQSPLDPGHLFALADRTRTEVLSFDSTPARDILVARHHAYAALPSPVLVQRAVTLDHGARALVVDDALSGVGHHQAALRLHFPNAQVRLRVAGPAECERVQGLPGTARPVGALAAEYGPEGAPLAVVLFQSGLSLDLERYEYSPGYGELRPAARVLVRLESELPASARWWVLF